MATNIPPHNLGEVIDACLAMIDNPAVTLEELLDIVPAPDFPTGGQIIGRTGARTALMTGPWFGHHARRHFDRDHPQGP